MLKRAWAEYGSESVEYISGQAKTCSETWLADVVSTSFRERVKKIRLPPERYRAKDRHKIDMHALIGICEFRKPLHLALAREKYSSW